ncbi:MAG: flagellar hook capping protein [Lachnospiraceae bacterium]|nr:flagellar hook capping protein [Lachnospiraceae bacterium]
MSVSDLTAQYVDGKLLTQTSQTTKAENTRGGNSLDKDAFLQLLVAQMKYQDPMEPTSNTEYISQYATFSELEQMQNMSSNMTLSRASEMVGKEVIVESKSESGNITTVRGVVEKVVYNSNKAYISINGSLYSVDDVKQVIDDEYSQGVDIVDKIRKILDRLPAVDDLTAGQMNDVVELYAYYQSMTDYQVSLLDKDTVDKIENYFKKASEITAAANAAEEAKEAVEDAIEAALEDLEEA